MTPNLLILGGTLEATRLCHTLAETKVAATVSLAGRVADPKPLPLPMRVGGFGGVAGLARYLRDQNITHVIDATHPFAAQMSTNAVLACAEADLPLVALTRPPWIPQDGDRWTHVPSIAAAVAALAGPSENIFLALGRMHLAAFAAQPQHRYLLRLVDAPTAPLPLPHHNVIVDRGPFDVAADLTLLDQHKISRVVSKNAGGTGAFAKIEAARARGIEILMIDRPTVPHRVEAGSVPEVMTWLKGHGVALT